MLILSTQLQKQVGYPGALFIATVVVGDNRHQPSVLLLRDHSQASQLSALVGEGTSSTTMSD